MVQLSTKFTVTNKHQKQQKNNSPLTSTEISEKDFSEKKNEILRQKIQNRIAFSIVTWNVKSSDTSVRADSHKKIISFLHAHLKSDIFCLQESLWVAKNFTKHTMKIENTKNFKAIGNKEASILYNSNNVSITDFTKYINLKCSKFLNGRFILGEVQFVPNSMKTPPTLLVASLHLPYIGFTTPERIKNASFLIEILLNFAQSKEFVVISILTFMLISLLMKIDLRNYG